MKKNPRTPDESQVENETQRLIVEYLQSTGRLIPQTPQEVADMEARLKAEGGEAPERLRKKRVLCGGTRSYQLPVARSSQETLQHLARAAREGKQISDVVEARMRQDREKSKREAEGER